MAAGLGIALSVVVARSFSEEDTGLYFAATSVVLLVATVTRLGTSIGLVYWVARLREMGRADELEATAPCCAAPGAGCSRWWEQQRCSPRRPSRRTCCWTAARPEPTAARTRARAPRIVVFDALWARAADWGPWRRRPARPHRRPAAQLVLTVAAAPWGASSPSPPRGRCPTSPSWWQQASGCHVGPGRRCGRCRQCGRCGRCGSRSGPPPGLLAFTWPRAITSVVQQARQRFDIVLGLRHPRTRRGGALRHRDALPRGRAAHQLGSGTGRPASGGEPVGCRPAGDHLDGVPVDHHVDHPAQRTSLHRRRHLQPTAAEHLRRGVRLGLAGDRDAVHRRVPRQRFGHGRRHAQHDRAHQRHPRRTRWAPWSPRSSSSLRWCRPGAPSAQPSPGARASSSSTRSRWPSWPAPTASIPSRRARPSPSLVNVAGVALPATVPALWLGQTWTAFALSIVVCARGVCRIRPNLPSAAAPGGSRASATPTSGLRAEPGSPVRRHPFAGSLTVRAT